MRTLIASDLHLGSASRADVLRVASVREALVQALRDVDRLVLLGDVLELRHGPRGAALRAAGPVLQELGAAMAGREIVLLAGNHDHALVDAWLEGRAEAADDGPLTPAQSFAPEDASALARSLAAWAAPANVSVAYPGFWVRDDVYAIHGHYLDCHLTVPTMERIAIAATCRIVDRPADSLKGADDYEAVISPVYAWIDAVAAAGSTGSALNGTTTSRMWRLLQGGEGRPAKGSGSARGYGSADDDGSAHPWLADAKRVLRGEAVRRGFPLAVAAINRAKLGPVKADVSSTALRQAGLEAMGEVAYRLGVSDAYVLFGHTHRPGPLPGDSEAEWQPSGVRLYNCGSWAYSPGFLTPTPGESPYWPGSCLLVEDEGPPQVLRLLADHGHAELRSGAKA